MAINNSIDFLLHEKFSDPNRRYIIFICTIAGSKYTLACLFAPNLHHIHFLYKVMKKINKHRQVSLIICGDFNIALDQSLDTSNPSPRHSSSMLNFLRTHDLHDVWRCRHTTEKDYTFFSAPHNSYSWIDNFLVDKWLLQCIPNSAIDTISWSDHATVSITITSSSAYNLAKLWGANAHVLQTSPYAEKIRQHLIDFFLHNSRSVSQSSMLWMAHKTFI